MTTSAEYEQQFPVSPDAQRRSDHRDSILRPKGCGGALLKMGSAGSQKHRHIALLPVGKSVIRNQPDPCLSALLCYFQNPPVRVTAR